MASAWHRRHGSDACGRRLAGACLLVALAAGCKSGTWAVKPPSWGLGGAASASSPAEAPALEKDVTKPSAMAKPYPTTDTPEAYSLAGTPGTVPTTAPLIEPSSVTYGAAAPAAQPSPQPLQQPDPVGPQVGPYASLQPAAAPAVAGVDPAAAATAGLAAAPAFGEAAPPATARVADARAAEAWPTPSATPATAIDPRYGQAPGSRFSTSFQPPVSEPAMTPLPSAPVAPPGPPPAAPADQLPGGIAPPKRRSDPGYRPGGTSSYRQGRAILAGDDAAGGVVPASLETSVP